MFTPEKWVINDTVQIQQMIMDFHKDFSDIANFLKDFFQTPKAPEECSFSAVEDGYITATTACISMTGIFFLAMGM